MADKVIFETKDGLTEHNLQEWLGRSSIGDYVESGLNFTADFTNVTLDISDGKAHIFETAGYGQGLTVFPDPRTGIALTDNTTNYVYIAVDVANEDSIYYHVDTDQTPPTDPSLYIGKVDTSNNTTVERNRYASQVIGNSLVVGGPRAEFQTIQGAIDWANQDGAWNDGNMIIVGKGYDESNETWPVTVTTRCEINGTVADEINVSDSTVPAFDVDLGGSGTDVFNRPPGVTFRNLEVNGGAHCFKNTDSRWTAYINCHAESPANDGWHFVSDPGYAVNSHTMIRCTYDDPGGASRYGVHVGNTVNTMQMFKCSLRNGGTNNIWVKNAASFAWYGGGSQKAGEYGIVLDAPITAHLEALYHEDNYTSASPGEAEIKVGGADNVTIQQCYFNGMSNVRRGIRMFSGNKISVKDCAYRGYTSNFMYLGGANDVDVHRASHISIDGTPFGGGTASTGKRPRDNGVIGRAQGGLDLRSHSGNWIGEVGVDDGTNTPSGRPEMAVWVDTTGDNSGDAWQIAGTENLI